MNDIPLDLMRFLGSGSVALISGGGSGALTLQHSSDQGARFVKYVPHRDDAVDGHESFTLVAKADQVRLIRETTMLREYVPPVAVRDIDSGVVLTAPVLFGRSPIQILLSGDIKSFEKTLRHLLDAVGRYGYGLRNSPAPSGLDLYTGRTRRRIDYIAKHLPGFRSALLEDTLSAVERIGSKRRLIPAVHYFPAHGDLNLSNVIVGPDGAMAIVDQRGVLDDWDPIYDVGKMLTSLWLQTGLEYHSYYGHGRQTARSDSVTLLSYGVEVLRLAVNDWEFGDELEHDRARLWQRVLYAAAVHAICEAACRISVSMSPFCLDAACEVDKAFVYFDLGRELLMDIERDMTPAVTCIGTTTLQVRREAVRNEDHLTALSAAKVNRNASVRR